MALISGRLLYDGNRTASSSSGSLTGIANVSIVLQNINTGLTLAARTDSSGNFSFVNVPNGQYHLTESYGYEPSVATPGDFNNATVAELLTGGVTPPISYVPNAPVGATHLDCTIRNTRPIVISGGTNSTGNNFLNGPVTYTPITTIMDSAVVVSPDNLIEKADGGTFGNYASGSNVNVGATPLPYTDLETDFIYVLPNPSSVTPNDGQFTIQNIMNNSYSNNRGTWWVVADRSEGNETGRMMVINGSNPGAVIFKETVTVEPNSYYLFSSWILNLCKIPSLANPALGVAIFDENGDIMYEATLGELIQIKTTNPEWKQIGTVFYTDSSTTLTLQFVSMGPAATGNDYVIDDISINKVTIPEYTPVKTVDKTVVNVGETVQYKVTLGNTGQQPLTNVVFKDMLPEGMAFVEGSVHINGVNYPLFDPNLAFPVPNIDGDSVLAVSFSAVAESVPTVNPTVNQAQLTYLYSPVQGGIPMSYNKQTNPVTVEILYADIMVTKTANTEYASIGDTVTYTLALFNNGPYAAENVVVSDTVPDGLTNAQYSVDEGQTWSAWEGFFNAGSLAPFTAFTVLISGVVDISAGQTIDNTANVTAQTFDPDLSNNEDTATITVVNLADLAIEKSAYPNFALIGSYLTYTLKCYNIGPSTARDVVVYDIVPSQILNPQYSVDNGTNWNAWGGSLAIGDVALGAVFEILIRVIVSQSQEVSVINTATVDSSTPDPDTSNNTSTVENPIINPMDDLADLAITKTAAPNPCTVGQTLIYTVEATNYGPYDALDVVIHDNTPGNLLNPEFSVDGSLWQKWEGQYYVGTLLVSQTVTILLRGKAGASANGEITNTATVDSTIPDPDLTNNTSTVTVKVVPHIDIDLRKTTNILIASVGLEELSLAHILNAEGEKIQYSLGTLDGEAPQDITLCDILQINRSVNKTLKNVVKTEMMLQFKLENAIELTELEE